MKQVKLKHGELVLVDDDDFEWLSLRKWHIDGQGYARTQIGRGKFLHMHRMINKTPVGWDTDHINRNKLDNRKENLRTATRSLSERNKGLSCRNTSGYKGIDFYKRIKRWRVRMAINKKDISLGYFEDIKDAIKARQKGEEQYGYSF